MESANTIHVMNLVDLFMYIPMIQVLQSHHRGGICHSRHCRRQYKIFASGVNFSIFTHFFSFFLLKLLKLGEIDGVKFLA